MISSFKVSKKSTGGGGGSESDSHCKVSELTLVKAYNYWKSHTINQVIGPYMLPLPYDNQITCDALQVNMCFLSVCVWQAVVPWVQDLRRQEI